MCTHFFVNVFWFETRWSERERVAFASVSERLGWFLWDGHNVFYGVLPDEIFRCFQTKDGLVIFSWNWWSSLVCVWVLIWFPWKHKMIKVVSFIRTHVSLACKYVLLSGNLNSFSCFLMNFSGPRNSCFAGPIVLHSVLFETNSSLTVGLHFELCLQIHSERSFYRNDLLGSCLKIVVLKETGNFLSFRKLISQIITLHRSKNIYFRKALRYVWLADFTICL